MEVLCTGNSDAFDRKTIYKETDMNTGFELIPTFVVESSCTISQYKCQYEISSNSDILDLCSSQYFDSTTGEIDGQSLTDAYALSPITYPFSCSHT